MMTKRMWKLKFSGDYSIRCERDGEMAVRDMSAKAQLGYEDMDGLEVYEYTPDDVTLYAYYFDRVTQADGLTFEELEEFLEGLAPEPDEDDDEEDD